MRAGLVTTAAAIVLASGACLAQDGPAKLSAVSFADAMAGKSVQLVLVKDWIKIENTGPLAKSAEFERYCAVADEEQVVLGRWVGAHTEGGTDLPTDIASAREDAAGNIVQTIRVRPVPPRQRATVVLTTLVARRERPAPAGAFPIPAREGYPESVRAYLAASEMVAVDDPYVKKVAKEILAKTTDAYGVAREVAEMAKKRTYLPSGPAGEAKSLAASVLQNGGSCCSSAVAAAAVLRACGIPAQVTYCPAGYVHGIVRFWLQGYGWVRMDATSGSGDLPLMQQAEELGLVRLFDTPMLMEKQEGAYAWPYEHNDDQGPLMFTVDGAKSGQVRMANTSGDPQWDQEPVPHLEPGSWSTVLGSEDIAKFGGWDELVKESRLAERKGTVGAYHSLVERLEAGKYARVAEEWGR